MSMAQTAPYRNEIDGLRAVAVLSVIWFHYSPQSLAGGFLGVDIFYVVSGYLISGIIFRDMDQGRFSFLNFFQRRIKRILPVLFAITAITCCIGHRLLYVHDANLLGQQGVAAIFSFSNIYYWMNSFSYWGSVAENSPLLHTWSLSLEVQFYFVFPLLAFFTFHKKERFSGIFLCLTIYSFFAFCIGTVDFKTYNFYMLPTRIWELGLGVMAAFQQHCGKKIIMFRGKSLDLTVLGMFIILVAIIFYPKPGNLSPYALPPVLGTFFILAEQNSNSWVKIILSSPPLTWIGKISYSLYLWHWPIIVVAKNWYSEGELMMSPLHSVTAIFMLSTATYLCLEKPIRYGKNSLYPVAFLFLLALSASIYCLMNPRVDNIAIYETTVWNGDLYNNAANYKPSSRMRGIQSPQKMECLESYRNGGVIHLNGQEKPSILVLGDSHSLMWSSVIHQIAIEMNLGVSFYGADGTTPFMAIPPIHSADRISFSSSQKYEFDNKRLEYIEKWRPKAVIISSIWSASQNTQHMLSLILYLKKIDIKVILIEQPPILFFGDKNAPSYLSHMGIYPSGHQKKYIAMADPENYIKSQERMEIFAKEHSHLLWVGVKDIYQKGRSVMVLDGANVLYIDDDHLSEYGAILAKARIKEVLIQAFGGDINSIKTNSNAEKI